MTHKKLIAEINRQFKASRSLLQPLIERRNRGLELYTGFFAVDQIENADGIRENVPYLTTLVDNTLPILTQTLPQSKVSPRSPKSFAPAKLMDSMISYTFDANDFQEKFVVDELESMLCGDHISKVIWNPNPLKNYPLITSIDINNISSHPAKLELDDEFPLYLKREMTKKQMKEETNWDHDAIDSLGESKLGDKSYRMEQMKKLGLPPEKSKNGGKEDEEWNLYEVVERWGMMDFMGGERKMGCVIVANGEHILNPHPYFDDLEPFESPFANNVMPFAKLSYKKLPNTFWAMSFIDPITSQQIELNDLEAMKKSNYIRRNNPPIKVDKYAEVDLSSLKFMAGLPWIVNGVNNLEPFILPDLAPSIEGQQMMIRRTMQNVTGATDILMTIPEQTGAKGGGAHKVQSAAHAQLLQESIKMRFMPQAMNIDRYIERIGKLLINLWQDKRYWIGMEGNKIALAIADDEGNNSLTDITNEMIQGELDFVVTSASSIAQSNQALATQAANLLQLFSQDPSLDMTSVKKAVFEYSGYDFNKIQKSKASYLPQLTQKLQQLNLVANQPNFKTMPPLEQQKVIQAITQLKQQIQMIQQQSQGQQGPGQPGQSMSGQQLQPEAQQ